MEKQIYGNILSATSAVPGNAVNTDDAINCLQDKISDELIYSINQLGVSQRYSIVENYLDYLNGQSKRRLISSTTELGITAVEKCILEANIDPAKICLFISITNTSNRHLPCFGYEVRAKLGNLIPTHVNIINMQDQGCAVLLKAVEVAQQYLRVSPDKFVVIVASEGHTGYLPQMLNKKYLGFKEIANNGKDTSEHAHTLRMIESFLFGDGAVAFLLGVQPNYTSFGPISHLTDVKVDDLEIIHMDQGGMLCPKYRGFPLYIMTPSVIKRGVYYAKNVTNLLLKQPQSKLISINDADLYLIHTGSKKILQGVCKSLKIDSESKKVASSFETLNKYGNLSSASIGFMIKDCIDKKKKGIGLMVTFGVGFSSSCGTIEFA